MPLLFIHALNSEFQASDAGETYDQPDQALAAGVQGAVALAADEIQAGKVNAAVEVRIAQEDGTTLLRSVVVISVSPLLAGSQPSGIEFG